MQLMPSQVFQNHAMVIETKLQLYSCVNTIHVSMKKLLRPSVVSFSVKLQVSMETVNFSGIIVCYVQLLGSIATSSQTASITM